MAAGNLRELGKVTMKTGAWLASVLRVLPGCSKRERPRRINKRPPTYNRVSGLTPRPGGTPAPFSFIEGGSPGPLPGIRESPLQ